MTDFSVSFWLTLMLFVDGAAIGLFAWISVSHYITRLPLLAKIGFLLLVCGLLVQIVRSIHYLQMGTYPVDHWFPLWITKDIGGSLLITHLALYSISHNNTG